MSKKNKSKKQNLCFSDVALASLKKSVRKKRFDAGKKLRDANFVAKVFFQALIDNDVDTALDALNGYLMATSKTKLAKLGKISTSTVYHALSQGANPTLRTLAKLLHAA